MKLILHSGEEKRVEEWKGEREKGEEVSVEIGAGSASWANFFLADRRGRAHPPAWR